MSSVLVIMAAAWPLRAQPAYQGKGQFSIDIDVARFFGDTTQIYNELYYGIHENVLSYRLEGDKYRASARMKLAVRSDSSVVYQREWRVPHDVADTSSLTETLMGIESFGLLPGTYTLHLTASDMNDTSRHTEIAAPLTVTKFPDSAEAVSDIEFCTSIQSSDDKKALFYKNTLEVVPNAGRLYGTGLPIMYYYFEEYNLVAAKSAQPNVIVRTAVVDAAGREVNSKEKPKQRLHNSSVEIGTVNLSSLHGGTYVFKVSLLDTAHALLASTSKKFFVYRPGMPADTTLATFNSGVATSEFSLMTEPDIDLAFSQAKYIATETERQQFLKLTDLKGKQAFLYEFWRRRDPDPTTSANEFKEDYARRTDFANKNYGVGTRDGWKTDRGRVYMTYGPCDEVERFPNSGESLPYEIWHYNNIQGGVIFVFVDRNGLGDYALVHSTHHDELQDANWYEEIAHRTR